MIPTVSVVIAAYNVEPYIAKAVHSVLAQTFQDFEMIIVDDRSTDGTADAVRAIRDVRIRLLVNDTNRGPSYSRNRAIRLSRGKWIAMLDGDDWWQENRLQHMLSFANELQADIVVDDLLLIRDGETKPWSTYLKSRERVIGPIADKTRIDALKMIRDDYGYLNPIISAKLIKDNGLEYKNGLHYGEDFRFLLECIITAGSMCICTQPLYYYRFRDNSLTAGNKAAASFQAQLGSVNQLLEKYARRGDIVRELRKYRSKKALNLAEAVIRADFKKGRLLRPSWAMLQHPLVIKPLLRSLIRS
ncbi:glycosyltransferase family 2 protein [Paenibacillus piri]|uniref:Glycosyltransferase family 2 protein n=1 Tax=Paenibacillus piri TaxID=2547395 RepID=A0A4R5KWD6_9BACL|nr:glycosyltransferase family 2 protein [Paenibacillus piri]TDG00314.1 glycosyltransferase family 2 protein [Paenibacillus piri]